MGTAAAGEPALVAASPEGGRVATRIVMTCSSCGEELPLLPAFAPGEEFRRWHGSVCPSCSRVYCSACLATGGSRSCPACGTPTRAAQLDALRQAGVVG